MYYSLEQYPINKQHSGVVLLLYVLAYILKMYYLLIYLNSFTSNTVRAAGV